MPSRTASGWWCPRQGLSGGGSLSRLRFGGRIRATAGGCRGRGALPGGGSTAGLDHLAGRWFPPIRVSLTEGRLEALPVGRGDADLPHRLWDIHLSKFRGAYFAVFPEKLVETCLLASTQERG